MNEQETDDLIALIGWQAASVSPSGIRVCAVCLLPGGATWDVTIYDAEYDLNVVMDSPDEWSAYLRERAAHPDRAVLLEGNSTT